MSQRAERHPTSRLWGALRLDEIPSALGLGGLEREGVAAKSVWTPDFVLLSALVALTIVFGRAFSKVKLPGSPIYVTEIALVGIVGLALWRLRPAGVLGRVRRAVPLVPLLLFWLAGAVATARGLQGFGFRRVLPDVALVEYSIFVPLLAVVADTRERIVRLFAVMFFAAIVTTVGFGFLWQFDLNNVLFERDPFVAIAMYMAFFVLLVLARLSIRSPVTPVELALAGAGLVLISVTVVRSAVFALAASLFVIVLLAPRSRRLLAGLIAVGALGLSVGGALLVEKSQQWGSPATVTALPPPPVAVGRELVAADGGNPLAGGITVKGDAAAGRRARRLALGKPLRLELAGLKRGATYTVLFAVKPLRPEVTSGLVGNSTGLSWGQQYWTAAPVEKWQFFRKTLTARGPTDELALMAQAGSPSVLFDAVRVLKGRRPGPSGDFSVQRAVAHPNFAADDGSSAFTGGVWVRGDSARGRYSRRLGLGQRLNLAGLTGLRRGKTYTVTFAVKPLSDEVTTGSVGDPTGLGWGQQYWTAAPVRKWQFFRKTLRATSAPENLALVSLRGAPRVLFDAVQLRTGGTMIPVSPPPTKPATPAPEPPAAAPNPPAAAPNPPAPKPPVAPLQPAPSEAAPKPAPPPPPAPVPTAAPRSALPLVADLSNTFGGESGSGTNVSWRLAIWHYMLRKTLHDPLFGVGFGRPTNFRWNLTVYDARVGNKADSNDVTGPHNSFVNLIFRTGLLGLLPLLALVGIAALRLVRALRSSRLHELERALLVGSAAIFVFVTVIASFNVALEGPYMGMFFWLFLGLLLLLPSLLVPGVRGKLRKTD